MEMDGSFGWMVGLVGWLVFWIVGLVGWFVGWMVGQLVRSLVAWLFLSFINYLVR
jgi:hypothetical protein